MSNHYTVCIVGAGIYGLIAAKTLLELYPDINLVIFDANSSLGGTWSKQRIYPELLSNSSFDTYEYSDLAIKETIDKDTGTHQNDNLISGAELNHYLETYAQKHHIREHIQFNSHVTTIEKQDKLWQLQLILATGMLVTPSFPNNIATAPTFTVPQYHNQDLAKIKIREAGQHVLVVGASKSALDVAYSMVKLGARVTLVIKEENTPGSPGPPWFLPRRILFNSSDVDKTFFSRVSSLFSPNVWSLHTWSHFFLHKTIPGRWLIKGWWKLLERYARWEVGYESNQYLKEFYPKYGLFWASTNLVIITHNDLLDMIKDQRICLKRGNINALSETNTVCFTDGSKLNVDLIIWATGWHQSSLFQNLISSHNPSRTKEEWLQMETNAENYLFEQCPTLKESPVLLLPLPSMNTNILYLYRRLVPIDYINDHSIVCVGSFLAFGTAMIAEVQALWSVVYLMNEGNALPADKEHEQIEWDIALTNIWFRRRYPLVERHLNYTGDFIQYIDLLLNDLRLKTRRKYNWLREIFEPYMPCDYKGLAQEWLKQRKENNGDKQKEE
ncbi:unnamed protein product [Adineta steineri]|uniref:Uncharacterized protein n=1 Tax=Adineta steineri TaxID=433720 RepID=A0A815JIU9_9BILA|nr:unnamed protein product [Adineta steineri]CAF3985542.1 unnamed protein product [Adineta steineri]